MVRPSGEAASAFMYPGEGIRVTNSNVLALSTTTSLLPEFFAR